MPGIRRLAASHCRWARTPTPCFRAKSGGKIAVTRGRFEKETGSSNYVESDAKRAEFRARDRKKAWLTWRAEQLAQFHRDVLDGSFAKRREDARLYLLGGDMFTNPAMQPMLRPTLPNQLRLSEVLLQLGIDVEHYAEQERIVFFRPERIAPPAPLVTQAVNINLATNSAADHPYSHVEPAASLFYHEALPLSLPSFDAASPFGQENTQTFLFTQVTPVG